MYQKRTMKKMSPVAKDLANLSNTLEKCIKIIRRTIPIIRTLELESKALYNSQSTEMIKETPIIEECHKTIIELEKELGL